MRKHVRSGMLLALGLGVAVASATLASHAGAAAQRYVCPPCGAPCDTLVFDHPGTCPQCGMVLVDQASAAATSQSQGKVAILIFDGAQIIDFTGPYEVFQAANYDVYTVAATKDPVTTVAGMTVVPKYTFADAPAPDVLVVPGGAVKKARDSEATLRYVRDVTARDRHTLSVCNGAFILASAGLLDGLSATTTAGNLGRLRSEFPKIHVVDDQRYVDNGKIVTAGGLTAGIDGALHVVEVLRGRGTAQQVALGEEYDWRPGHGFARATLADLEIPDVDMNGFGKWDMVSTHGDTDRWETVVRGTSEKSPAELLDHISQTFEAQGKWKRVDARAASATLTRHWTFQGRGGKPWSGIFVLEPVPGESHAYTGTLTIARAG